MKRISYKFHYFWWGLLLILLNSTLQAADPLYNPVSSISINTVNDDWEDLLPFGYDFEDITGTNNKLDWDNVVMADSRSTDSIYLKYQMWKPIESNNFWAHQVFIDTDESDSSGYKFGKIGADFLFEGSTLWRYTGSGNDWSWAVEEAAEMHLNGNIAQFRLSRHILADNSSIRLFFYGNNAAYGGDTPDVYPNGALENNFGNHYYTYKFHDSLSPTVYSNSIADDFINFDGNIDEWTDLQSFSPPDPSDVTGENNKIDWRKNWMAHTDSTLYVAYELENDVVASSATSWAYQIYIDTDESTNTGYRNGALGADFIVKGKRLYRYTGSGTDWSWQHVGSYTFKNIRIVDNHLELKISRKLLGSPERIRFFFHGDNTAFGGDTYDVYPDGAFGTGNNRYFTYEFNHVRTNSQTLYNVTVDGDLSEWTDVQAFETDPDDVTGSANKINWLRSWMGKGSYNQNENAIFLAYQTKEPIDQSHFWAYQVYLDTDKNGSTGFKRGAVGADYLLEGSTLWHYTGTGNNWSWEVSNGGSITYAINGNIAEFVIEKPVLYGVTTLRMILSGNNAAFGGDTVDVYPNGAFDIDERVQYLSYH